MFLKIIISIVIIYFRIDSTTSLLLTFPKIESNYQNNEYLNLKHIQNICNNSIFLCKSNDSSVCTTRQSGEKNIYRDFENSCFLFVDNMCRFYGSEFSIVSDGTCANYLKTRRNAENSSKSAVIKDKINSTTKPSLREDKNFSPLYETDTAFDLHICPLSCPNVYSPVCVGVNRGHGVYYKFFTFSSHCAADLYYCKNWREFSPPPDLEEMVNSSPLSWSYCAANRFIQFARFTEMTTSMGHYGWLAGDYSPTHILEPHERQPGYGRKK